jgi:hypothetical protein
MTAKLPYCDVESRSSKERRQTASRIADLTRALAEGEDPDRHAVALALQILEDIDGGICAPCGCDRSGCAGPANHWTPHALRPEAGIRSTRNYARRTENAARLETLAWAIAVLERNPADAQALELERYVAWIRDTWLCGPLPADDLLARRAWAERIANARKAPPAMPGAKVA